MRPKAAVATVLIGLCGAAQSAADGRLKLAVIEIQARRGVDPVLAKVIEEFLVNEIGKSSEFSSVIGRDDIQRMLDNEQEKQLSGCEEDSCLAEIGGAMGVDRLVAGAMDRVGASVLISLKVIDVRTGFVVARESERLRGATEEDALDGVTALFGRLFRTRAQTALPRLAVTEIKARRGVDPVLARVVEEFLAGEITKTRRFSVIGRDDIARLMDHEQQKVLLGCEADACLAELCGALGAQKLLAGAMDKVGTSVLISLKLIDARRAKVERRESERLTGATEEAALDAVTALFRRMFSEELAFAPAPQPEKPEPEPTEVTAVASAAEESPAQAGEATAPGRVWAWVTAGAALALVGAGTGLLVVGQQDLDDAQDLSDRSASEDVSFGKARDARDQGEAERLSGGVLLGVGGAAMVAAVVLFFVEKDGEPPAGEEGRQALTVVPGIGPERVGLMLQGTF